MAPRTESKQSSVSQVSGRRIPRSINPISATAHLTGMGLDWKSQYQKINDSKRYGDIAIPLETAGGIQKMLFLPVEELWPPSHNCLDIN